MSACTPLAQTDNPPTITITPEPEAVTEASTLALTQVTNTPLSSSELTPILSQTPLSAVVTKAVTPTATPTLQPEMPPVTGQLFVSSLTGIQRVTLADGTSESLLTAQNDWLDWGANFAQNKEYVVYKIKRVNEIEVWVTPLLQWQPERILVLEEDVDGGVEWAVNDRYILFRVFFRDTSGPLEEIKITRTYVIDTETMELVSQPYWPGACSILAASPQTGQLALWCAQVEPQEDSEAFLVLEPDEVPWVTQETPETLIDDCLILAVCDWSKDGEFVAYVVHEGPLDSLFYTSVDDVIPVRLDDKRSNEHAWLIWSPDSQFLYYSGACIGVDLQCPNVISVVTQDVIWRARNNNFRGEMGEISISGVAWASNSQYIAIPVTQYENGIQHPVILFDIFTQQEVGRWAGTDDIVLDMVWVDN